jgi:hypothetical protein
MVVPLVRARLDDHALLGRVRDQIRLLGDGALIAGEIGRAIGKISRACGYTGRVEAGEISRGIDAAAVSIRLKGGRQHSYATIVSAITKSPDVDCWGWLARIGLLAPNAPITASQN